MDGKGYASVCPDIGINWKAKTCLGAQMVILPLGKAWRWGHKEDPWSPESKTFSSRSWSHKEASSIATVVQQLEGHYSFRFSWVLRFPDCLRSQTTSIIRKSFAPFPQRNAHTHKNTSYSFRGFQSSLKFIHKLQLKNYFFMWKQRVNFSSWQFGFNSIFHSSE